MQDLRERLKYCSQENNQEIHSLMIVGSNANSPLNTKSDIDCVFIFENKISAKIAYDLGNSLSNHQLITKENQFCFNYSDCSKCTFSKPIEYQIHFSAFEKDEFCKWVAKKDFLMQMWSKNYEVLWGKDLFNGEIETTLTPSLLDKDEGITGLVCDLKDIMFTKDPVKDVFEYDKTVRYHKKQLSIFKHNFPKLFEFEDVEFENIQADSTRKPLLELSEIYSKVEKRIYSQLNLRRI